MRNIFIFFLLIFVGAFVWSNQSMAQEEYQTVFVAVDEETGYQTEYRARSCSSILDNLPASMSINCACALFRPPNCFSKPIGGQCPEVEHIACNVFRDGGGGGPDCGPKMCNKEKIGTRKLIEALSGNTISSDDRKVQ